MRVDPDLGAISFGMVDEPELTARVCAALQAGIAFREFIIWVERVELASAEGPAVLFHDEDGTSHLDLTGLDKPVGERIVARLRAPGF